MAELNPRTQAGRLNLLNVGMAVAVLHLGQDFLRPVVLAVLLSFLLAPVNRRFERLGCGRVGSVLITMSGVFALLAGLVVCIKVYWVALVWRHRV